jgi:hypothetical protein
MRKQLLFSGCSLAGMAFLSGLGACSSNPSRPRALADSGQPDATTSPTDTEQGCKAGAPISSYVLIDDMETTNHGPIDLDAGIRAPLTPGYWYNSGATYSADGGAAGDTSDPPQGSFAFSALATPTKTLNCNASAHAARQFCVLNGLYDTCGVGFEFAQEPDRDAGAAPSSGDAGDAGDAGPSIPRVTVPFDISRYKAITFWGMTTTPDPATGALHVKVQLPDTDTDPRGQVCNGAGPNISRCYNSYAAYFDFTTSWQQFTVLLDAGDGGVLPDGGIAIDRSWGYQQAQWIPTQIYGINWQAQKNTPPGPDGGPPLMTDIWIDDVYFIQ